MLNSVSVANPAGKVICCMSSRTNPPKVAVPATPVAVWQKPLGMLWSLILVPSVRTYTNVGVVAPTKSNSPTLSPQVPKAELISVYTVVTPVRFTGIENVCGTLEVVELWITAVWKLVAIVDTVKVTPATFNGQPFCG